jgi:hypothetical protein
LGKQFDDWHQVHSTILKISKLLLYFATSDRARVPAPGFEPRTALLLRFWGGVDGNKPTSTLKNNSAQQVHIKAATPQNRFNQWRET